MEQPFHIVFLINVAFFTMLATVLSGYTLLNMLRLRNVLLTWRRGPLNGFPLFSTIFLAFLSLLVVAELTLNKGVSLWVVGAYAWCAVAWFSASYAISKVYINDFGIVKNLNDPSQTLAWHDVIDYVESDENDSNEFVFMFYDGMSPKRKMIRLEITVPPQHYATFKKILHQKLGRRFQEHQGSVAGFPHYNKF